MDTVIALALGLVPSLLWLAFFLREDSHPEPRKMITLTYAMGAVSAFVAFFAQYFLNDIVQGIVFELPRLYEENIAPFLSFAFIEEISKFLLVYIVVRKSRYFDEPIDAMIYMITGALGFATVEDVFIALQSGGDVVGTIVLRFIGATLLHALSAGIIGHYWARGIKLGVEGRFVIGGIFVASLVHTLFNILITEFNDFLVYPVVFLILVGFFVLYDFEDLKGFSE